VATGKHVIECHLSLVDSKFSGVNVLGIMDVFLSFTSMAMMDAPQKTFSKKVV
jgi:hypothetical protein